MNDHIDLGGAAQSADTGKSPMNEELRTHLMARHKELTDKIAPLQTALIEVNSLLRLVVNGPTAAVPVRPVRPDQAVQHRTGTTIEILRNALIEAGDVGLTWKEAAAKTGNKPYNTSARLSKLKADGEVDHVGKRYIMKPEFRNGSGVAQP